MNETLFDLMGGGVPGGSKKGVEALGNLGRGRGWL